jgi:7,8-dihydroneopterin aldolase/epimerase/oxygenase
MWVTLNHLSIQCIVGIYDFEREQPQELIVELALGLKHEDWLVAAGTGELARSIDYSRVAQQVREITQYAQFRLIESLYLVITHLFLSTPHASEDRVEIEAIRLSITKPLALSPSKQPTPSISGTMTKAQWSSISLSLPSHGQASQGESLTGLSTSNPFAIEVCLIVDLPEVYIAHISTDQSGTISVTTDTVTLIPLSTHSQVNHQRSWSDSFSALYIQRRMFTPEKIAIPNEEV